MKTKYSKEAVQVFSTVSAKMSPFMNIRDDKGTEIAGEIQKVSRRQTNSLDNE